MEEKGKESNNILIISDTPTHPTTAGNRNLILSCSRILEKNGYCIKFLYITNPFDSKEVLAEMKDFWKENLFIFKTSLLQLLIQRLLFVIARKVTKNFLSINSFCPWGISSRVKELHKQFNFTSIIVNYIWLSHVFDNVDVPNKIVLTHDVFSHKYLKGNSKWFSFSPSVESKALQKCNKILAVQENEAIFFRFLSPFAEVFTIYCPFQFKKQLIVENNYDLLFFSGENSHNLHGIESFVSNVFTEIKKAFPNIKLVIGGGICKSLMSYKDNQSIKLLGRFENPDDFYVLGNIVINPVFEGTGLKIKTFEAISYGKLVLAHPHSFEGVFDPTNIPMIRCESTKDYLNAINEVINGSISFKIIQKRCEKYISNMNDVITSRYMQALK